MFSSNQTKPFTPIYSHDSLRTFVQPNDLERSTIECGNAKLHFQMRFSLLSTSSSLLSQLKTLGKLIREANIKELKSSLMLAKYEKSVFVVGIPVDSACSFFVASPSRHRIAIVVANVSNSLSKGLNFSVHGDAAWGAYFCSMMRDEHRDAKMVATGFVPEMYLSTYVSKQLSMLKHCDTITIDPHKSGFCPYPAGAICYRDKTMNSFLQITTGAVYYHGDMTLGDIGIEGSKPGAAAAGVMLANRVMLTIKGFFRVASGRNSKKYKYSSGTSNPENSHYRFECATCGRITFQLSMSSGDKCSVLLL